MQKVLQYNINEEIIVEGESIKGFMLKFGAFTSVPAVAVIADLGKISLDVELIRKGRKGVYLMQSNLRSILTALYAQTPKLALNTKVLADGYLMYIDFFSVINLREGDMLKVRVNARNIAFTSLSTGNSTIEFETVPAIGNSPMIPVVNTRKIGNGEDVADFNLGDKVTKITVATDYTAAYDASAKAKVETVDVIANGFNKTVSENVLRTENTHYLDQNPESDVQNLVAYWSNQLLNNVRFKVKLDAAADNDAQVLWVSMVPAR